VREEGVPGLPEVSPPHADPFPQLYATFPYPSSMAAPEDKPRTVLVDFHKQQWVQELDDLASTTIIHASLYRSYHNLHKNGPTWDRERLRQELKLLPTRTVTWRDEPHYTRGYVTVPIMVDGCSYFVTATLSTDPSLIDQVILGRDVFELKTMSSMEQQGACYNLSLNGNASLAASVITSRGQFPVTILLDTGAGPSVMSLSVWECIAGDRTLHEDATPLRAANNQSMEIVGRTPPIRPGCPGSDHVFPSLRQPGRQGSHPRERLHVHI
jgi:hypothetical protein